MRILRDGSRLPQVLLGAVLVLLPLVAILQYRWIGQLSDAERARLQANLRGMLARFRQDFDDEMTRVFVALQAGPPPGRERTLDDYADRFVHWRETAPYPELVRHLYATPEGDGGIDTLLLLDPQDLRWRPTGWPAELVALRPRLEARARQPRPGPAFRDALEDDVTALVLPRFYPVRAFLILELDLAFLQGHLLPELAQRHFSASGHLDYQLQIITRSTPSKVIYQSDPGVDFSSPDASSGLFEILPNQFPGFGGPPGPPGPRPRFRSSPRLPPDPRGGRWLLLAKHRSGSLETAVSHARLRNLAISFAVLLLMGVTMGLLVVSTHRAQRLARLQMEFVAGVSHELRTPLAVISSAADNLADGLVTTPEQARRYGDAMRKEGRRLADMVQQVLTFASAESGRLNLHLEPADAAAAVARALAACEAAALEAGCRLEPRLDPDLPPLLADPNALTQCIQNLILNACKYATSGQWIGVHATRKGAWVQIAVEDRGPGIDPGDWAHLFEPFYRGRRVRSSQVRGTGLGLSLVQRMMEAQGGSVSVRSALGRGACFVLTLAVAPVHETTPAAGGG